MRVLRAAAHRRMPWKNGRGETVEVAVFPEGSDLEGFDWRVSMAGVVEDGQFSIFPGIDRGFAVLEGAGIALAVGGAPEAEIRPGDAPFFFSADEPAAARLLGGPITDLNVMTRRGRFAQAIVRAELATGQRLDLPESGGLLLCQTGEIAVAGEVLGPLDALLFDAPATLRALAPSVAFAIALRRL